MEVCHDYGHGLGRDLIHGHDQEATRTNLVRRFLT